MSYPFRIKDDFRIRSSLAKLHPTPQDSFEVKRSGWCDLGILVIDINHGELSHAERRLIEQIGTRIYGRRAIDGR